MTNPRVLSKSDDAVPKALSLIDSGVAMLQSGAQTAQDVLSAIASNFIADASSTFQKQVQGWYDLVELVIKDLQTLAMDLQSGSAQLDSHVETANQTALSWDPGSDAITRALVQ